MQIDPHNIVLYRSVYTGERIDSLLGLIQPAKTLAEGLDTRVRIIEDKLSPKVVLTIQQMDFTGGTSIQSPAGGEIIAVEDLPRGYKCYFDTNHGSAPVLFHVNDQAMGIWRRIIIDSPSVAIARRSGVYDVVFSWRYADNDELENI